MTYLTERLSGWHRPMTIFGAVMVAAAMLCLVGLAVDDRIMLGQPIWLKPFKFAVSMAAYFLTWGWMYTLLDRWRRTASAVSTAVVVLLGIEYAAIVGQVLRGRPSHFNESTTFDSLVWDVMAYSIVGAWLGSLVLTIAVLRSHIPDPAIRSAIRLAAPIALVGMALAFLMTSVPSQTAPTEIEGFEPMVGAHSVGVVDGGPGMPITGWSTTGGDLRVPHFVGMHALQALPLLVLLLAVLATRIPRLRPPEIRARLIVIAGIAYSGLVALVTWQALRGQPLIRPDELTLAALAVLTAGTLIAASLALHLAPRPTPDDRPVEREQADAGAPT